MSSNECHVVILTELASEETAEPEGRHSEWVGGCVTRISKTKSRDPAEELI